SDIDVIDLSGINARVIQSGPESGIIEYLDASGAVINTQKGLHNYGAARRSLKRFEAEILCAEL
ncbi:MAG: hypothetical protein WBC85_08225, partial [Planktotalea sp.]|uniref:hypothetical protein n=1 Tax=Planktotalea sp. TaxID=2029877 RepID=UPI003C728996